MDGRDYVRAIQLRTGNLPTAGMPSNLVEKRKYRARCNKTESMSHVLQQCPSVHWERIRRHNEIAKKIANHNKKADRTLEVGMIIDIQVCWNGDISLNEANQRKANTYNNEKFITAFK